MTQYAKKNDNIFKYRNFFFKQKKEKRFIYTYIAHTHTQRNIDTISICDSFVDIKCQTANCQVLANFCEKNTKSTKIKMRKREHCE